MLSIVLDINCYYSIIMLQIYIYMMPYIYGNFELFFVSRFLFFKYH